LLVRKIYEKLRELMKDELDWREKKWSNSITSSK
jgi:hypothetical protein